MTNAKLQIINCNKVAFIAIYTLLIYRLPVKSVTLQSKLIKMNSTITYTPEDIMEKAGIKPTSNRILVLRALLGSNSPQSLAELEENLQTLDKSSIHRVLSLFTENHIVHALEDGRGIVKFELCTGGETHGGPGDMHVHFYCEQCHKVYCFDHLPVPTVPLPEGFTARSVNYMLKGICPDCAR